MADPDLIFWVFFLLALMPVAAAAGWLLGGVRRRRPPKPLPGLWWVCPACRSVNAPDRSACYSCGAPLPERPTTLPTARDFSIVQRFGPQRPVDEGARRPAPGPPARPPADPTGASSPAVPDPSPAPRPGSDRPADP